MADSKKQRRIQLIRANVLILGITLILLILAFFIPGLQIVATVIGLSAVFAPLIMFGLGVIAAVVWNVAFAVVSRLIARNESNDVTLMENQAANQVDVSPPASQRSTPLPTSSFFSFLFGQASKDNGQAPKDNNANILQLATHVVRGEQAQAEAMIRTNPGLLLKKCRVVDYSGRTSEGTPLQLALAAEDVKFHEKEECMAEMIIRYLMPLSDGEKHKATQILAQFPEGWEEQEEIRAQKDEEELEKVVQGIDQSKTDEEAEPFLKAWEDYLASQKEGIIRTGKHVNTQLLAKAFELYDKKYYEFGGPNSRKNNLFWLRVIGQAQRDLPANYAQAFCQDIEDIVEYSSVLIRSLVFKYDARVVFYPLDTDSSFRLGVDYAARGGRGMVGRAAGFGCRFYQFMSNKKQEYLKSLCREQTIHRSLSVS